MSRSMLSQVIAELDEKKREALEKTWRKVDADFGSIFSTLLPGTSAKLEPPEGASFLAGALLPNSQLLTLLLSVNKHARPLPGRNVFMQP